MQLYFLSMLLPFIACVMMNLARRPEKEETCDSTGVDPGEKIKPIAY